VSRNELYMSAINYPSVVVWSLRRLISNAINPLIDALKQQSNGLLYSDTVIGTLAVDGWAITFGTARRGLGGLRPRPVHSSLYQM